MKTLLARPSHCHPLFSSQSLQWRRNHPSYTFSSQVVQLLRLPLAASRCMAASSPGDSAPLNGWDDLVFPVDPGHSAESNMIRNYSNSLGIGDKRYVIVYILGFVCALAVSRVRVPSIVVAPAAAIVFAIGFSWGFLNGRPRGVNSSGGTRKSKGGDLRITVDQLRNLLKLFGDLEGRVGKLKDHISVAVENQKAEVDDLKSYDDALELMGLCVKKARSVVDECVDFDSEVERNLNKKPNRKRKESGGNGFNLFQLAFSIFQDNAVGAMTSKKNEGIKSELKHEGALLNEERVVNSKFTHESRKPSRRDLENAYFYQPLDFNKKGMSDCTGEKISTDLSVSPSKTNENFVDVSSREINIRSSRVRFTDDQHATLRMLDYDEIGQGISHDAFDDDDDEDIRFRGNQRNVSSRHTKLHQNFSGTLETSQYELEGAYEGYSSAYRNKIYRDENLFQNNDRSRQKREFTTASSSTLSDDILFDKYLSEAYSLLKQAKDGLCVGDNKMPVEQMLHESTKLLSMALSLKPMSLLATGLLGNSYLLLGELKLRFSQELRHLISGSNDSAVGRWSSMSATREVPLPAKDKLVTRLIDVCEECEELLVKAGRKYRTAMSIDGSDVRALYNWGVALSFRAQLIADIGPETASDADKLFLAAIDKFDAMMSRNKTYAPEALYRWAMVLRQRSRLRPRESKDKVKLLQQSKRLYEDALEMGFDKLQEKP